MIDQNSDDRLSQLLQELGPADPPAGFSREVMARIAHQRHTATERITPFNRRIIMTKKAMLGLAAAAVVAIGVFAVTGFPPVGRGTEGTIGAAKKYEAPQIDKKDVVLGDAATQEFLQSAEFDRLLKDPDARALMSSAAMQSALKNNLIRNAYVDAQTRQVMASAELARLFTETEAKAALADAYRANASAAVKQAARETAAQAATRAQVARAMANQELTRVLNNADLVDALLNTNHFQEMARAGLKPSMIQNRAFADAIGHARFDAALRNPSNLNAALAQR